MENNIKSQRMFPAENYTIDQSREFFCYICGRNVRDLEPFSQEFVEVCDKIKSLVGDRVFPLIIDPLAFARNTLTKRYRTFGLECGGRSSECLDCADLSDEEATERWSARVKN